MTTEKRLFDDNSKFIKEDFNKRLIRLDHALRVITPEGATELPNDQLVILLTARKKLKNLPIVDAVEVVHGRWRYYSTTMQECSNCQRHTARHKFKYCPHCGAVMEDKYYE